MKNKAPVPAPPPPIEVPTPDQASVNVARSFESFLDVITPAEDVYVILVDSPDGLALKVPKDNFLFDANGSCIFVQINKLYHPWHRVLALQA